jgi:tRNA nucleotidyltransferase (CCA-adding enzyme)
VTDSALAQTLLQRLDTGAGAPALEALNACRRICRNHGITLYLVGGAVRDLLLDREGYDLDLTLEADIVPVAQAVAAATGGKAVTHDRFGTGRVSGRGFRLDMARARRETYPHPGSLPVVEPATLTEDLARRDFTINAVALRLEPEPVEVIDPFRGVADAHSSLLRVLHDRSFQDDATRMLRAVRYAARLNFKIATQTAALIRRDLAYLGTISGPRLRRDLALLFEDPAAVNGTTLAQDLGILRSIHPALGISKAVADRWRAALAGPRQAPLDELGFCVVADARDEGAAASVSRWLHLAGRVEHALADLVRLRSQSPKLAAMDDKPSQATELLDRYVPAAVWARAVLEGDGAARVCLDYLTAWRHVRPSLTGTDLLALGVPQGEGLGETLRELRAARLDGRISTRDEEVALVRSRS